MNITRIEVEGLKSTGREAIELSPLTLIIGPNGEGKSLVKDAIDFVLTGECAGVSAAGSELRDAVGGDVAKVVIHIDTPDGPQKVIKERAVDRKTGAFKRPSVVIDGDGVFADTTDAAIQHIARWMGDPSAPRNLLDISADKLTAALASIGAKTIDSVEAIDGLSDLFDSFAAHHASKMNARSAVGTWRAPTGELNAILATLRESARRELADAREAKKKVEGSTDRSRTATADDGARPDDVPRAEAAVTEATARLTEAKARHAAAQDALTLTTRPDPALTQRVRDLDARRTGAANNLREWTVSVEALRAGIALAESDAVPHDESTSPESIAALTAQSVAAATYLAECVDELASANTAWALAVALATGAAAVANAADAHLAMTERGECPTCGQTVGPDVVERASHAADVATRAAHTAAIAANEAHSYLAQVRDDVAAARSEADRLNAELTMNRGLRELRDLTQRKRDGERAQLATAEAQKANADASLREIDADLESARAQLPPPPNDAAIAALRESVRHAAAHVDVSAAVAGAARIVQTEAVAARERHLRWRADLDARTASEKRVEAASALFDKVRSAESRIAATGARALFHAIDRCVPPAMGRAFVDAGGDGRAPAIGIRANGPGAGVWWSGAGLSGAQRLILSLACDRAVDDIYDRPFRLAMVEADALDSASLAHLCDELRADVAAGTLHQAIVITCHAESLISGPRDWRVIYRGDVGAGRTAQEPKLTRETWAAVATTARTLPQHITVALTGTPRETATRQSIDSDLVLFGDAYTDSDGMRIDPADVCIDKPTDPEVVLSSVLTTGRVPDEAHHAQLDIDDFAGIGAASSAPAVQRTPLRLVETPAAMPAWLARPGTTGGANPSVVDAQALVDELTAHDAAALRDWPAHAQDQSRPSPSWVPLHMSIPTPAFDRCIAKDGRTLTPIGAAAWRILRGVDAPGVVSRTVPPVEPASAESQTAPDGSPLGATADEIRAVVKDMSADALRSMYVQHGGGKPGEKATVGVMRKAIASVGATRGHHVAVWQVWATDSAAAHPRKVRASKGGREGVEPDDADGADDDSVRDVVHAVRLAGMVRYCDGLPVDAYQTFIAVRPDAAATDLAGVTCGTCIAASGSDVDAGGDGSISVDTAAPSGTMTLDALRVDGDDGESR